MNATLSRSPVINGRAILLIAAMMGAWVLSALSTTPAVKVLTAAAAHAAVCHCAHCPGVKLCCCGAGVKTCP